MGGVAAVPPVIMPTWAAKGAPLESGEEAMMQVDGAVRGLGMPRVRPGHTHPAPSWIWPHVAILRRSNKPPESWIGAGGSSWAAGIVSSALASWYAGILGLDAAACGAMWSGSDGARVTHVCSLPCRGHAPVPLDI